PRLCPLVRAFVLLVLYFQLFDAHFVVRRVGRGARELARPRVNEVPARDGRAVLIVHHDRAIEARFGALPLLTLLAPLPHVHVGGDAALERDIVPLHATRDLLHHELPFVAARLVFDDLVL